MALPDIEHVNPPTEANGDHTNGVFCLWRFEKRPHMDSAQGCLSFWRIVWQERWHRSVVRTTQAWLLYMVSVSIHGQILLQVYAMYGDQRGAGGMFVYPSEPGCSLPTFLPCIRPSSPRLLRVFAERASASTSIPRQGTGTMRTLSRQRDTGIAPLMEWHLSSRSLPTRRRSWLMPREPRWCSQ